MDTKKITIARIAELAGVSKTTASLVLNGQGSEFRIKEETRERVKAVARANHYSPNSIARSLKTRRSGAIGLAIPDLTNQGFAQIARTLEACCRETGLQLLIACTDDDPEQEKAVVTGLAKRQIEGLIVASSLSDDRFYQTLLPSLPVVQVDRRIPKSTMPFAVTDAFEATASMMEMLARQGSGRSAREYVFLGGQPGLSTSEDRRSGFIAGLERSGISVSENWILQTDYQVDSGYRMLAEFCTENGRVPDVLFTSSFTLFEGVMRYLKQNDLLPQLIAGEMHLATFDNHELLDCLPMDVDSIAQSSELMASSAFAILRRIGEKETQNEPSQRFIPAMFHWRGAFDKMV